MHSLALILQFSLTSLFAILFQFVRFEERRDAVHQGWRHNYRASNGSIFATLPTDL